MLETIRSPLPGHVSFIGKVCCHLCTNIRYNISITTWVLWINMVGVQILWIKCGKSGASTLSANLVFHFQAETHGVCSPYILHHPPILPYLYYGSFSDIYLRNVRGESLELLFQKYLSTSDLSWLYTAFEFQNLSGYKFQ